jgi:hypothetical protein
VTKLGEKCRLCRRSGFYAFQRGHCSNGIGGDAITVSLRCGAPGFPVKAEELMQQAGAFKSQWNWRVFGQPSTSFVAEQQLSS